MPTYDERLNVLENLVRIGTVYAVDHVNHTCRVRYNATGITSGVLKVLNNRCFIPGYNQTQRTDNASGGSGYAEYANHAHTLNIVQWMPSIDETVLCLYVPVENGDGYVLGGIP